MTPPYVRSANAPSIWYQCDAGDADPATFFHYMGLAAGKAAPRGATSLAPLTPEYLAGIEAFTRRFFEGLYDRLLAAFPTRDDGPAVFIVLDNYQDVPAGAPFHEMIVSGLDIVPAAIRVVIMSRDVPPATLARMQANGRVTRLEAEDLRFTHGESRDLISRRCPGLDEERIGAIQARAEGWAAGIILMLERARLHGQPAPEDSGLETVFDYFATEILAKSDARDREFLLATAFLPTLNVILAERLTGTGDASRILSELNRHNYFTDRLAGSGLHYRYHPLFRDFLRARAAVHLPPAELARLLGRAAQVLAEAGATEDAAGLLAETGDWDALARLLADLARAMVVEGRGRTLEGYLRRLPAEALNGAPVLQYWLGVCRMPFDIEESRSLLDRAFLTFDAAGETVWAIAAWAAMVDSIITEHNDYTKLDRWLEWLDGRGDDLPGLPPETENETVAFMLFGLTFRQPGHPRIGRWRARAEALVQRERDLAGAMTVGARLLLHYTFLGAIHEADQLLSAIKPPATGGLAMRPLALIQWEVLNAIYAALGSGSFSACLAAVERGLDLSRQQGIHVFEPMFLYYGAVSAALAGNEAAADRFLGEMVALRLGFNEMNLAYYMSALAWRDLLEGDARTAAERMEMILHVTERLGHTINALANRIGLAHALFELGDAEQARAHLDQVRRLVGSGSHWFEYSLLVTEAYFAFRERREADGLAWTSKALALGRKSGATIFVYWRPAVAGLLCTKALGAGLEPEYVKELVRRQHLRPDPSCPVPDGWPWPVEVRTMGAFRVARNGESLGFSRKTPRKPLYLLKALIAFGGSGVPIDRIIDALWPDADGDLAQKSFETTLLRLRRLLGVDACLESTAGYLSLNPQVCRVDSVALGCSLDRFREVPDDEIPGAFGEAARLYQGHFLPSDGDCAWVVTRRELLRNRFLALTEAAGGELERDGRWENAADCYRKGLECDDLSEGLYRGLMLCYQKLGRRSEAVRLYLRCRQVLATELGIAPSVKTEELYASLVRDGS